MEAVLKIPCKNPNIILKSLKPDIEEKRGIKIDLKTDKNNIIITINTQKISYLKAVVNSYLSLVKTLKQMEKLE